MSSFCWQLYSLLCKLRFLILVHVIFFLLSRYISMIYLQNYFAFYIFLFVYMYLFQCFIISVDKFTFLFSYLLSIARNLELSLYFLLHIHRLSFFSFSTVLQNICFDILFNSCLFYFLHLFLITLDFTIFRFEFYF